MEAARAGLMYSGRNILLFGKGLASRIMGFGDMVGLQGLVVSLSRFSWLLLFLGRSRQSRVRPFR